MNSTAVETIKHIISNKVILLNMYMNSDDCTVETFERYRHELTGMLICLKNINEDEKFYCFNFYDDKVEFGYYDENYMWVILN